MTTSGPNVSSTRRSVPAASLVLVWLALLAGAVVVCAMSVLLLCVADTWRGRGAALTGVLLALVPTFAVGRRVQRVRVPRVVLWAGAVLGAAGMVALVVARPGAPTGSTRRIFDLTDRSSSTVLGLVPETDQLAGAFSAAALVDPLLTSERAARLRGFSRSVYRELECDPEFAALPTALGRTYADVFGLPDGGDRAWLYVPASLDRGRPAPLVVFFHGSGGAFRAYLWILAQAAERAGCVVLMPCGGVGRWRDGEAELLLQRALRRASAIVTIDPRRVHLAGLSNGARAVSQLVRTKPMGEWPLTSIWISPVFDEEALLGRELPPGFAALVVSGAVDERVPWRYVYDASRTLLAPHGSVRRVPVTGADHFLMFSHRNELVAELAAWLRSHP